MHSSDPLAPLLRLGRVESLVTEATEALAAVHRRPAALRTPDIFVAESVLRGARLSTLLEGGVARVDKPPEGKFGQIISVHSLLAPDNIQASAARLRRSPANIFARLDVLAGGDGRPADAARVGALALLIDASRDPAPHQALVPQVVHAEISAHQLFGPRSAIIGRVVARLLAVGTGFDPRGLAVPEVYLHRHKQDYERVMAQWTRDEEAVAEALEFLLRAWIAGAAEAEAIIRAA